MMTPRRPLFCLSLICMLIISNRTEAQESLVLYPSQGKLTGPQSSQRLLLQRNRADLTLEQLREGVTWTSSDPALATVSEDGVVTPLKNGTVEITASARNEVVHAQFELKGMETPRPWSFRNDILPALTKAGCNMGACHGALAGKGGFRLSLRGYDPDSDHFNIVKQDRGRRVEFSDPGRSLVLAKPSGGLPHKGGLRFDTESRDYQLIADWIAHGAAASPADEPLMKSIEIYPKTVQLLPGTKQQLIVRATYSDGRQEDVTPWVKWTSANDAACQVNEQGVINVVGPGEGAVSAWFNSQIAVSHITVPFQNEGTAEHLAAVKPKNFIDKEINRQLQLLNLPPSQPCDDATFIRRCFLDTIGLLPTAAETQKFLADSNPDKRDKLIDALLARPEFVDYWTYKWSDILMLNGTLLRPAALAAYYKFVHDNVEKNTPWDVFVSDIITSRGSTVENGATNFYALFQSPEEMTENVCQAFMGLSIGCAKCHNHPMEKWTNDQYYAMANLFSRVRAKGWGGDTRNGDGNRVIYVSDTGELVQPRTGKPQPPTPLDGTPLPFESTEDRRAYLAKWLVAPENPYFAKSISNRIWANYFGVGLVEGVDDMRVSNPPSNEELLNKTADYLVAEKYNLKSLMKIILQSNSYQRSSLSTTGNAADKRYYSHYLTRRLNAEVLHDAIVQVTGVPTEFNKIAFYGGATEKTTAYPLGTRAIQLHDAAVDSYFLKTFGRNQRNIVCECERSREPTMVQVLNMSNGDTVNQKLESPTGRVAELTANMAKGMSPETLVDECYLACLSRYPTSHEREGFVSLLIETSETDRRELIEDLFWALVTSREFVFNH